jgi:TIR domain-containing protein
MSYVPGYDHDFFVSYAKVDNDAVPSAKSGWVETLMSILISGNGLAGKLGRREAFDYWIDEQKLRGNDEVDQIPEQVRRSALFVAVLSPAYTASKFCQLELETFLKSTGGAPERLFIIYKEQLVERRHKIPEAFVRPRKYKFWDLDKSNKPRVLGWPQPIYNNPEDRPYFQMVDDLCNELADKLEELKQEKEQEGKDAEVRITTAAKPMVLLAETTDDLMRKRDEVRRYLELAGVDIVPAGTYYGLARADYEKAFLSDLSHSAAFVQLVGPELGRCLNDVPDGFGWLQYQMAKDQQCPILQWRSPDLRDLQGIEDDRQRRLLDMADAMPLEDFKKKIVGAVTKRDAKVKRPSFVFIDCDSVDTDNADAVGNILGGQLDWERPPYEEKPKAQQLENEIQSGLIDCDGLFIVYGRTCSSWVRQQLQLYRKLRPRRAKELSVLAVVQTGPEPKELKGVGLAGLKIIGLDDVSGFVKPDGSPWI